MSAPMPTSKRAFDNFMKTFKYPATYKFGMKSASEWTIADIHKLAIWQVTGKLNIAEGKFREVARQEVDDNVSLTRNAMACASPRELFVTDSLLLKQTGEWFMFYMGLKELQTKDTSQGTQSKSRVGKQITPPAGAQPIIVGKRIRKPPSPPHGILTNEALAKVNQRGFGNDEDVMSISTDNGSGSTYVSDFSTSSDEMNHRVIDEVVASTNFHIFCKLSQAELETFMPPTDGHTINYTLQPVSFKTKTALGETYGAKSDGAAWLHQCTIEGGYARHRASEYESLFIIEAKASQGAEAVAQQVAQCIAFMGQRIQRLIDLGHDFGSMKGLDPWLWEVYILCINQTMFQVKYIKFPLGYLQQIFGAVNLEGGLELRQHNVRITNCPPLFTHSADGRIDIIKTLHEISLARKHQVQRLHAFKQVK